jgi:hypothetical protein
LRCATGTPSHFAQTKRKSSANQAQIKRKSTRKSFPKDVRYIRNGAQTILPAAQIILPGRANHFRRLGKPFCLEAQIILLVALRRNIATAALVSG